MLRTLINRLNYFDIQKFRRARSYRWRVACNWNFFRRIVYSRRKRDVMISRDGDSDDVTDGILADAEDFSDVMDGGNVSDLVAVWGFLVDDANWTQSSAMSDSGRVTASTGDSDDESVVWTTKAKFTKHYRYCHNIFLGYF